MHQDIAEMDHITAPALLAYRGGDVFATIVDVLRNIPRGRSCSADSLEDLLKLCVSPSSCSFSTGPYANFWWLQTPCAMILSLLLCFQPSTFTGIAARRLGCSLVISALFDLTCLSFFFYSLKHSPTISLCLWYLWWMHYCMENQEHILKRRCSLEWGGWIWTRLIDSLVTILPCPIGQVNGTRCDSLLSLSDYIPTISNPAGTGLDVDLLEISHAVITFYCYIFFLIDNPLRL